MSVTEQPHIDRSVYFNDLMTGPQKLAMAVRQPMVKAYIYIFSSVLAIIFPFSLLLTLPMVLWVSVMRYKHEFPAYTPRQARRRDPYDPEPGDNPNNKLASADVYIGRHRGTGKEVWITWAQLMTHIYMLGTTGSGKTEAIWTFFLNALSCGSGFSLGDGKGTYELLTHGRYLARRFGMESDYFIINYDSGSLKHAHKLSTNTLNTFNSGTAAQLKEVFASLALSGDAGQNQFFEDGAAEILERLFPAMVELRDKELINLDIQKIGSYMPMHKMYELGTHPEVSKDNQRNLLDYLEKNGFDPDKGAKQHPDVVKQHGQFINHFGKTITSLSIQYRNIYVVDQGEINQRDILFNRRLLIFSLPSLQKSGAELQNLGKILLTGQKNAVAADSGDFLEGTAAETTLKLSKNYRVPYFLGYDEWSFYAIKDMALVPAQVRTYRYCALYGAQDYAGTERAGEIDAESVMGNARTKLFGALEASGKSWQKIREVIGECRRAVSSGYRYLPGLFGGRKVIDIDKTEITKTDKIELDELQGLRQGEWFLEIFGKISPIRFFFVNIESMAKTSHPGHQMKINRFLRVYAPDDESLEQLSVSEKFVDLLYKTEVRFTPSGILTDLRNSLPNLPDNPAVVKALSDFIQKHAVTFKLNLTTTRSQVESEPETGAGSLTEEQSQEMLSAFGFTGEPSTEGESEDEAEEASRSNEPGPIHTSGIDGDTAHASQSDHNSNSKPAGGPDERPIQGADDPLLSQTLAAKRLIETAENPREGASILSDAQSESITEDLASLNKMLGYAPDRAQCLARTTIEKIQRHCYYLAPPRPEQIDREHINDLKERVDKLLDDD